MQYTAVPLPYSVTMTSDLKGLVWSFGEQVHAPEVPLDAAVDRGACRSLFREAAWLLFGEDAHCHWENATTLHVVLGRDPSVRAGDLLQFNSRAIHSVVRQHHVPFQAAAVQAPPAAVRPRAVLSAVSC